MTIVVRVPGYPDRYACERCRCEVGLGRDPASLVARIDHVSGHGSETTMRREIDEGEFAVKFDPACPCHCHDTWRLVMKPEFTLDTQPW